MSKLQMNLRIIGQELVTVYEKAKKGTREEHEMIQIKLRGLDGDRKTRMVIRLDPQLRHDFPIGDVMEITGVVNQQRLKLESRGKST